jgi:hypothetical protein
VVQTGEAAEYDVRVSLLTASEVSQGARILFGVLAGASELAVQVDVFDTASNALLVSFTTKGESDSHPLFRKTTWMMPSEKLLTRSLLN